MFVQKYLQVGPFFDISSFQFTFSNGHGLILTCIKNYRWWLSIDDTLQWQINAYRNQIGSPLRLCFQDQKLAYNQQSHVALIQILINHFRLWHCHIYRAVNHHTAGDIYKPVNHLILSTSDSKTRSLDCMNCNVSVNQTSASKAEIPLYSSHQCHDWDFAVCNPCPSQAGKSDYPLISTSRIWKKRCRGANWIEFRWC